MSVIYWGEAMMTTVHQLNRSLTSALDDKTSYEACERSLFGFGN